MESAPISQLPAPSGLDSCWTGTGEPGGWPSGALSVAFMDPYQALGVSRSCTREQVKEVFRTRAWHAHPDRGGEDAAFIRLCTAYKQILEELDRRPNPRLPNQARSSRPARPAVTPGESPIPDTIFVDEIPPSRWPPKPFDPNWKPDLILLDEVSPVGRLPKPPDPRAPGEPTCPGSSRSQSSLPGDSPPGDRKGATPSVP